jgi:hypothetical protein
MVHRDTFIAKLTEIQQNVEHLLSQLQPASMTSSRLPSTGREENTGQLVIVPAKAGNKSSALPKFAFEPHANRLGLRPTRLSALAL